MLGGQKWNLAISTGYAAALTPSKIGAMVVADHVLSEPEHQPSSQTTIPIKCHSDFSQTAFKVGLSFDENTKFGPMVTVPRIVNSAFEKQELAQRTGAIGLDMESAVVGQIAEDQKIPFIVVRGISDLLDEDLPEEFKLFLRPYGWVQGLSSIIASPKSWADMVRLQNQMVQTSRQITKFFQIFFRQSLSEKNEIPHELASD